MTLSKRDRAILLAMPAVLALTAAWFLRVSPNWSACDDLSRRIRAAGGSPEAWNAPAARAAQAAKAAAKDLEAARGEYAAVERDYRRECGDDKAAGHTTPGALAVLNQAAASSGAAVVTAVSRTANAPAETALGVWDVTLLGTYEEMSRCLAALAEEPGVLVRRIDRMAAEDAGAKPVWTLVIDM